MFRILLLQTGDMILGELESDIDYASYTTRIINPVRLDTVKLQQGSLVYESYVMKSWMPMMNGEYLDIQTAKVITTMPIKPEYEEQYISYIEHRKQKGAEVATPADFDPYTQLPASSAQNDLLDEYFDDDDEDIDYDDTPDRTLH